MKRRSWLALVIVLLALWVNGVTTSSAGRFRTDDDISQPFCDDAVPCAIVVHQAPVRTHVIVETQVAPQLAVIEQQVISIAPKTSPPR